jgi:hypothetical protein
VAAEAHQVERTRRKTCSRAESEFLSPSQSIRGTVGGGGPLSIIGRRLDAPAPPLGADVPSGYGMTGFQASGVKFPTEGHWEVTGRSAERP